MQRAATEMFKKVIDKNKQYSIELGCIYIHVLRDGWLSGTDVMAYQS